MIYPVKEQKQTSWKIVYNRFEGMQRRAVEFLSTEMGKWLNRQDGLYTLFVLPCVKEGVEIDKNAVVVGLYDESETVRRYISKTELDGKDYAVKVVINPKNPDGRIVVITAQTEQNLYYGTVAFIENYPVECAPLHGGLRMPQWRFNYEMPEYAVAEKAVVQTRGVWSWAHPIGDYRKYIRETARLKFNQMVLWNDYMPLNAKDVVDYAHEFGIKVLWGYAWGWEAAGVAACAEKALNPEYLQKIKENAILQYERDCLPTGCDGIYFQSFTEMSKEEIGGQSIARVVTGLVNDTSAELLRRYPNLHIQFGLHATSVKNRLHEIAQVDKRVEIVWEDCGAFPYSYEAEQVDEEQFNATLELTRKILTLRPGAPTGLIFKGMMTLNWEMFVSQSGPYILGEDAPSLTQKDREIRKPILQIFEAGWLKNGGYALRLIREVIALTDGKVNLSVVNEDGGGITLPLMLFSEMLWNPDREYPDTLHRVSKRKSVIED